MPVNVLTFSVQTCNPLPCIISSLRALCAFLAEGGGADLSTDDSGAEVSFAVDFFPTLASGASGVGAVAIIPTLASGAPRWGAVANFPTLASDALGDATLVDPRERRCGIAFGLGFLLIILVGYGFPSQVATLTWCDAI